MLAKVRPLEVEVRVPPAVMMEESGVAMRAGPSVELVKDHAVVFAVITTGANDFIASGVLLDKKF